MILEISLVILAILCVASWYGLWNTMKKLEIMEDWNIPAPPEHLEFKLLDVRNKIIYFLKTFYFDLVNKK